MFKTATVIPNLNGEDLLTKNLPNILKSKADEVIILDDGSTDKSVDVLEKFQFENPKLQIIKHTKNKGFIPSVNELFEVAKSEIIVLLNNDVFVEDDFLEPLLNHFSDNKVFAVNCHEEGEGPAIAFWKAGFFEYKRGEEKNQVQKSSWASGGSAAFSRKIWQELGGFDPLFEPFYFEDTDISFRAIKQGYKILWDPRSKVKHSHETTISKTVSQRYKNWVVQRNQLLFIWKNIKDKKLLKDHQINLAKRLVNISKLGYWIPFLWALSKLPFIKIYENKGFSDEEVVNYAG